MAKLIDEDTYLMIHHSWIDADSIPIRCKRHKIGKIHFFFFFSLDKVPVVKNGIFHKKVFFLLVIK